jgi:hypothetical protein
MTTSFSNVLQGADFVKVLARTTVAAIVGGTASKLSGGSFANGARTAAMQHLFNFEATAKLSSSFGKLTLSLSQNGDLSGKINFDENFSVTLNDDGTGVVTQGRYSVGFEGLDTSSAGLTNEFKALNVNVSIMDDGGVKVRGTLNLICTTNTRHPVKRVTSQPEVSHEQESTATQAA